MSQGDPRCGAVEWSVGYVRCVGEREVRARRWLRLRGGGDGDGDVDGDGGGDGDGSGWRERG
jgi:hypothetical protein